MPNILLVMIGGAVGAGLRYEVGRLSLRLMGPGFPWGTLAVNLVGCLLMGALAGFFVRNWVDQPLHLLLGVGVLGGFTTFSAFALDGYVMLQRGDLVPTVLYVLASVIGTLVLVAAGYWLTKSFA